MRVSLAYDADEAGHAATEHVLVALSDWFTGWGTPQSAGPTATALAGAQRAYDDASTRYSTLATLAENTTSQDLAALAEEAHDALLHVADYVLHLVDRLADDRPYLTAETAEELIEATKPHRVVEDVRHLDWARLRERIDLVDFASQYAQFKPRGRSLVGPCILPDHEDSTPSLHLYPDERNWYCFGCHRWGDVFDLAKAIGVSLRDLGAT